MKSLKKVRGKIFLNNTEEQRNQLLVGMKARATRCKIFII